MSYGDKKMGVGKKSWRKGRSWAIKNGKKEYSPLRHYPRDRLVTEMDFVQDRNNNYHHKVLPFKIVMTPGSYRLEDSDTGHLWLDDGDELSFVDRVEVFMAPLKP
jgi:hypothetical protein